MKSITIQISDETVRHIESLIAAGEYLNVNEYFAMLIERDQHAGELPRWMEAELLEGVESLDRGEGIEVTPEYWAQLRKKALDRIQKNRGEVA